MKILPILIVMMSLSACGTMHNIKVDKDLLTGKNVCFVSTQEQKNYVTTGNPGSVIILTYLNYKLDVNVIHFYPLTAINMSEDLKNIQVKVDSNEIITISDLNKDDEIFVIEEQRVLIEQMIKGKGMILRVNYYDGLTKDFELNLSEFSRAWNKMEVQCQSS